MLTETQKAGILLNLSSGMFVLGIIFILAATVLFIKANGGRTEILKKIKHWYVFGKKKAGENKQGKKKLPGGLKWMSRSHASEDHCHDLSKKRESGTDNGKRTENRTQPLSMEIPVQIQAAGYGEKTGKRENTEVLIDRTPEFRITKKIRIIHQKEGCD